jgi:TatD DNase family protein
MIDTHCHLDFKDYRDDLDGVLDRAAKAGVEKMITVGIDGASNRAAVALAKKYDNIFAAVGFHPNNSPEDTRQFWPELAQLVKEQKVVAVGETGLDYYRDRVAKDVQREAFIRHIALARENDLPIIVHCREAYDDCYAILKALPRPVVGVMHCFSGTVADAKRFLELGMLISVAGPVTYPNANKLREVVKSVQPEQMMLETDAPFLAPQAYRGERNEPAYVRYVATSLAVIHGLSPQDIYRITTLNANALFGVGPVPEKAALAYMIRDSLYLNVTGRCSNACEFCIRFFTPFVKGHYLRLDHEPTAEEILAEVRKQKEYKEVVFCGLGEPTYRLDLIKEIARELKKTGMKIRINTNGHGDLINGREICPELKGLVDAVSVSLNEPDAESYHKHCRPEHGEKTFPALLDFVRSAKKYIPDVVLTALDMPGADVEACRRIANELGVQFRVRAYNVVG